MKADIPELCFSTRSDFRRWLCENAQTKSGVWLVFGKTKEVVTLTANEALEEALCFGLIDGLIKSIDETRYLKYFTQRRTKSVWSEKNKKTVEMLRNKKMMTALGEKAIEAAAKSGTWDSAQRSAITDQQVKAFAKKLKDIAPAYENFEKMPPSARRAYTRRYLSFKSEEARQRDFDRIIDRLNKNQKPM